MTSHAECPRPTASPLPSHVIDLIDYDPNPSALASRIRIREGGGVKAPYCALSYRWSSPGLNILTLTRANSAELAAGFDPRDLSSEIQDACVLTKHIGLRYLWVDALVELFFVLGSREARLTIFQCIVQGDGGN